MGEIGPPAPRPCQSCPYRRDVPSGVWAPEEYAKLAAYDRDTMGQPAAVFLCHQHGRGSDQTRVCAGWAGSHDTSQLLALRLAPMAGSMTEETWRKTVEYRSPVPLFRSGAEAARHGLAEVNRPGPGAARAMAKIGRRRSDLRTREN